MIPQSLGLKFQLERLKFEQRQRKHLIIEIIPSSFYGESYLDGFHIYGSYITWCETENTWKNQIKN